jgi:hypothetical protein
MLVLGLDIVQLANLAQPAPLAKHPGGERTATSSLFSLRGVAWALTTPLSGMAGAMGHPSLMIAVFHWESAERR